MESLMNRSLVASAMVALSLGAAQPAAAQVQAVTPAVAKAVVAAPGTSLAGAAQGDVSVVEYLDYNCPYCRKMHAEIQGLLKADPKARVLYKQWPVFGPVSTYAARAVLAATWQGKDLAAHDALITSPSRLDSQDTVRRRLAAAGVDLARLDRDLIAHKAEIDALLERSQEEAQLLGLRGTPALVIGSTLVPGGLPSAMLQRLVAQERNESQAPSR
jgi:protein-disulfide isomerase